jgi:diacylglycerol kinase family enzyme
MWPSLTSLEAVIDGEPEVLETPVEFRVEPGALRVLVPPPESG